MIKLELVFGVIAFVVWVYTLVEVVSTPGTTMRTLPKPAWVVVVLLFPLLGTIGWFVLGRPERRYAGPRGAYERATPAYPEYDRPGRAAATDPERDEEFLRQVRARAEEQRKRHELERRRREAGEGS